MHVLDEEKNKLPKPYYNHHNILLVIQSSVTNTREITQTKHILVY